LDKEKKKVKRASKKEKRENFDSISSLSSECNKVVAVHTHELQSSLERERKIKML
jgi:hypothetical protein